MALISTYTSVPCEACGKAIEVGTYAYLYKTMTLCEDCMDERLSDLKDDCSIMVDENNFELEREE